MLDFIINSEHGLGGCTACLSKQSHPTLCPALLSQVISMWVEGSCHEFRKAVPRKWLRLGAAAEVAGTVISPMPGKIIQVRLFIDDETGQLRVMLT